MVMCLLCSNCQALVQLLIKRLMQQFASNKDAQIILGKIELYFGHIVFTTTQ